LWKTADDGPPCYENTKITLISPKFYLHVIFQEKQLVSVILETLAIAAAQHHYPMIQIEPLVNSR